MAALRDLRKRLRSVRSTGALAGAMKTVSAAKLSRVNTASVSGALYACACKELVETVGGVTPGAESLSGAPVLYVLFSGNRGLCGGYNTELFAFFADLRKNLPDSAVFAACGKTACGFCRDKKIPLVREFAVSDVPLFEEAREISGYFQTLYSENAVSKIVFVCQNFINMFRQEPVAREFLPSDPASTPPEGDVIFIPDRETVADKAVPLCFDSMVYSHLLKVASGAQAATLMAMRSAYDNANESAAELETAINRRRQTEVTAGVIETAADFAYKQ